jgi:hypothetical protein
VAKRTACVRVLNPVNCIVLPGHICLSASLEHRDVKRTTRKCCYIITLKIVFSYKMETIRVFFNWKYSVGIWIANVYAILWMLLLHYRFYLVI